MTSKTSLSNLTVEISVDTAMPDQLDELTWDLLHEIREIDVDSAELVKTGEAVEVGTKAGDVITIGAIALTVLPTVLPKLVEFMQAWTMRSPGRIVKFKGKIGGQDIEFDGSPEDLKAILDIPPKKKKRKSKPKK